MLIENFIIMIMTIQQENFCFSKLCNINIITPKTKKWCEPDLVRVGFRTNVLFKRLYNREDLCKNRHVTRTILIWNEYHMCRQCGMPSNLSIVFLVIILLPGLLSTMIEKFIYSFYKLLCRLTFSVSNYKHKYLFFYFLKCINFRKTIFGVT